MRSIGIAFATVLGTVIACTSVFPVSAAGESSALASADPAVEFFAQQKPTQPQALASEDDVLFELGRRLHEAVQAVDPEAVRRLLEEGAPTTARDTWGLTPLHVAAFSPLWVDEAEGTDPSEVIQRTRLILGITSDLKQGRQPSSRQAQALRDQLRELRERVISRSKPDPERLQIAELLLNAGADPNVPGPSGSSVLQSAVCVPGVDMIDLLLRHGADAASTNAHGQLALHSAALLGRQDVAERLLVAGANPNLRDASGNPPAVLGAYYGQWEFALWLVGRGADVNLSGKDGATLLQLAAGAGRVDVAEILLDAGADLEVADEAGFTALLDAVEKNQPEVVQLLLDRGADVRARRHDRQTGLHLASAGGYVQVATILLDAGLRVDTFASQLFTPLQMAVGHGHPEMVKLLLDRGSSLSLFGPLGRPIDLAAGGLGLQQELVAGMPEGVGQPPRGSKEDYQRVLDLLLEAGADPFSVSSEGVPPLHRAARFSNLYAAQVFLDRGVSVVETDPLGRTALHAAAEGVLIPQDVSQTGNVDLRLLELLIRHGADPEAETKLGVRPITSAASTGNLPAIGFFLQQGAAVGSRDRARATPLHYAALTGREAAARLLVQAGADVNAVDLQNQTPLHIAASKGYSDVARLLLESGARLDLESTLGETPRDSAISNGQTNLVQLLEAYQNKLGPSAP